MRLLLLVCLALAAGACTDANGARKALSDSGYTDIKIAGYAAFSCSEDDFFATKFTAKGPTGRTVSGAVCSAPLKGKTIRLD